MTSVGKAFVVSIKGLRHANVTLITVKVVGFIPPLANRKRKTLSLELEHKLNPSS